MPDATILKPAIGAQNWAHLTIDIQPRLGKERSVRVRARVLEVQIISKTWNVDQ